MCKDVLFLGDESGEGLWEWVVVAVILLLAVVAGLNALGGPRVQNLLDLVKTNLRRVVG